MNIAFLYSGQGSQRTGMGKGFYDAYPVFREIYDNAEVGFRIADLCFDEANSDRLNRTSYTQPCLVAYQIGVTKILNSQNIWPQYAAGISLGEYSALYAAGVWDEKETLKIVSYRGRLMENEARKIDGTTVSILGLSHKCVEDICTECSSLGTVQITNDCCEGNLSIGGMQPAVAKACELANERGAKKCVPLKSPYPFHTELFHDAGQKIAQYLKTVPMREMKLPVLFNYTGKPKREGESIVSLLEKQVYSTIRFQSMIEYMESIGVDTVVEISPCNVNSKAIKRISDKIKSFSINQLEDLEELLHYVQKN